MAYNPGDATEKFKESVLTKLKSIDSIFVAIILVLIVAVISFLLTIQGLTNTYQRDNAESNREKATSYDTLREKYDEQSKEIVDLKMQLQQYKNDFNNALDKKVDK